MAVYEPAIMLQGELTVLGVVSALAKVVLAIMLWAAAVIGYWRMHLAAWERIGAVIAACLLAAYLPWSDEIGLALAVLLMARHWHAARRADRRTASADS